MRQNRQLLLRLALGTVLATAACVRTDTPTAVEPRSTEKQHDRTKEEKAVDASTPDLHDEGMLGNACPPGAEPPEGEVAGERDDWSAEQWLWKKRLCWNWACDYVADVSVSSVGPSEQLVQVLCVPGAYQPMSYLFSYNPSTGRGFQLELGDSSTTDDVREIWGHISFEPQTGSLKILSLARGTGDCGLLRTFVLAGGKAELVETRAKDCSDQGEPLRRAEKPEDWPLVKR